MKKENGFTLIELLITIVIAGIVLAIGVPGMQSFEQNNRLVAQNNSLIYALQLARGEAIRRGTRTTVCSSSDGLSCSNSTNWANGWMVFVDGGTAGSKNNDDTILQVWSKLSGDTTLSSTASNIQYIATGRQSSTTTTVTYTLTRPSCVGNQIKTIVVNPSGRPSTTTTACP